MTTANNELSSLLNSGMTNEISPSGICRLCAELGLCINVFSQLGQSYGLNWKISQCFSLTITETDVLPRNVCLNCVTKLNTCHEMLLTCIHAQAKLKALSAQQNQTDVPTKVTSSNIVTTTTTSSSSEVPRIQQCFLYPTQMLDPPVQQRPNVTDTSSNANNSVSYSLSPESKLNEEVPKHHNSSRTRAKERKTVCQYCRKWFPRAIIEHHENLHIKGGVFFTCVICNQDFRTKQEFSSHYCNG